MCPLKSLETYAYTFIRGQQESPSKTALPIYDPSCYLCPSNSRAGGEIMPKYQNTFVFVNDFSAVKDEQPDYDTAKTSTEGSCGTP